MLLQHLKVNPSSITPYVLLPGDPARVDLIGNKLENFRIIGQNREFRVGIGSYCGVSITACSTGIGCSSTAIAVEELIDAGAKILIRVGTCGGAWRSDIPMGSLIIPTASIRDEGTTKEYIPEGFPAVADFGVVGALRQAADYCKMRSFVGINRTHDAFYCNQNAMIRWGIYLADKRFRGIETSIISSEMESAALFVIASLRGVSAGAVFAVNAEPEPLTERIRGKMQEAIAEKSEDDTTKIVDTMISTALEAIKTLAA